MLQAQPITLLITPDEGSYISRKKQLIPLLFELIEKIL
jgi:hypothetical protein